MKNLEKRNKQHDFSDSRYNFYGVECRGKSMIDSKTEYKLTWIAIKWVRPRFGENHDENTARSK